MTELADLTATELLEVYRTRQASPVDALHSCLSRIDVLEKSIGAVQTLCAERALDAAKASTRRWKLGTSRPLEGVPFGLKDIIETAGVRTTGGSRLYADHVPRTSATAVRRLERAGAVLLAKTRTFELARGGEGNFGSTHNPWNLDHTAGGSSSGSAAALAAREMPLALGSDTGGSISIPSGFCGITGLKPTQGVVPRTGVMPQSWTLDHVGPMARSAEDVARMLTVIAGHDREDVTSIRGSKVDYVQEASEVDLRGLRIGVPANWFFEICDPQVEAATRRAIDTLVQGGAEPVDVELPNASLALPIGWVITYAKSASLHDTARLSEYDQRMQQILVDAQFVSAKDYLHGLRARTVVQRDFERAFERCDVLIVPGLVTVAPSLSDWTLRIGDEQYPWDDVHIFEVMTRTTIIFDVAGIPALSVPSGLNDAGLPMSVQIAARPRSDGLCLGVGRAFQQLTSHHLARPPLLSDVAQRARAGA